MKKSYSVWLLSLLGMAACTPRDKSPDEVMGYAPIYQQDALVQDITSSPPQPVVNGGKIYIKGNDLYQVEAGKGIHVLDLSVPSAPEKVAFLQVPGAQELSIRGNLLYTNNYNDLVVLDISDKSKVRLVARSEAVFHLSDGNYPPERGYFECVDLSKGAVIGWEKKMLYSPKCRY